MKMLGRTKSREEAIQKLYSYEITSEVSYDDLDEYALYLVESVLKQKEEIDKIISACLVNYSIGRLNYVDLSIIRVATLEMLNKEPSQVIINEAINLTKKYSNLDDDKAKAFNNKLLDSISKFINAQ